MIKRCKLVILSVAILLTASCEDTLDTSSNKAKEHSIEQMLVGIYPENQKIFKRALTDIYSLDHRALPAISIEDSTAITDAKINDKTIEDILHMAHLVRKNAIPRVQLVDTVIANNKKSGPQFTIIKASLETH